MKPGLLVIGIIVMVIGAVLYFLPSQAASGTATTFTNGVRTSSTAITNVVIPSALALGALALGFLLFALGILLPGTSVRIIESEPREEIISQKRVDIDDDGSRKIIRERRLTRF